MGKKDSRGRPPQGVAPGGDGGRIDLEGLLEVLPHGVQETDAEGKILYANAAHHRIHGYGEGELIGLSICDLKPSAEEAAELRRYLVFLAGEQPAPTPWTGRDRRKDGSLVDVRVDWDYRRDGEGRVTGFISVITDVSGQKGAEEKLLESERRLRSIVESVPMGIHMYECGPGGALVFSGANPAADRILGVDNSGFVGKTIEEAFPPLSGTQIPERYRRACLAGEPWHSEQIDYEDDRIRGAYEVHAFQTSPGRMAAMFTDITERKRAEEGIRESEERFRTIFEHAMDGILLADRATKRFVTGNGRVCAMLGYPCEELPDLGVADIHPREDLPRALAEFESLFGGEKAVAEAVPVKRRDGSVFFADISAAPVRLGGRDCLIGIFRDVTERLAAERERTELQAQVRQSQKMEALGTLAGGIAHDFNNILGAILGYTELAQLKSSDEKVLHSSLDAVMSAVDQARQLVQQVLFFSRPREEYLRPLEVEGEMRKALAFIRMSTPSSVVIRESIGGGGHVVLADATQVHQVLLNLCTNAVQAMGERGVLEVGLRRADPREARSAGGEEDEAYVRISVRDTGQGMTPEVAERIFDPFFTTKGAGKGSGMGLAIVHGIVKAHRGLVTVDSSPGKGSTFNVFLPLAALAGAPAAAPEDGIPTGSERILFVDDEERLALLGKELLQSLGYRVEAVSVATTALEIFRSRPGDYDLVVTDQTMPGLTGADLAAAIMAIRPDVPVVLCTGYSSLVSADEAKALGIREFLLKPLGRKTLALAVRRALDAGAAAGGPPVKKVR